MRHPLFGLFGLSRAGKRSTPAWPAWPHSAQAQTRWSSVDGTELTLRAVRSDDAALLGELFDVQLSRAARYSRFHGAVGRLSAARLAWMADADFKHHVAFVVTCWKDGLEHAVAEGRWVRTGVNPGAEFALSVADAWQGHGIGQRLLAALLQTGRDAGLSCLLGDMLASNQAMQALARSQGLECGPHPDDAELVRTELSFTARAKPTRRANAFTAFTTAAWQH